MEDIVKGIFSSVKLDRRSKLVAIQTLKPQLLMVDVVKGDQIRSLCLDKISDDNNVSTRALSSHILAIIFQVYPERVLSDVSKQEHSNKEYHALCSKLITLSLKCSDISFLQGRCIAEMLANNKHLHFSDSESIAHHLYKSKHWFEESTLWLETYFYYCGLSKQASQPMIECTPILSEQSCLVTLLKLIGSKLANGSLSAAQGAILSGIKERVIVETASQEFLASLTEPQQLRCFDNLICLQKQGVALSHWILSLLNCLCSNKRLIQVVHLSERYVDMLFDAGSSEFSLDSLELICHLLLFHQHSPLLFHRNFTKLAAHQSVECVSRVIQSLVMRYPHFGRLYGKTMNPSLHQWHDLKTMLHNSKLNRSCGVGLNNLGNTCYFNSLIQALWLSVPFQEDVIFNRVESSILAELRRVFLNLSYSINTSFSPDTLFHVLRPPWFSFGSQQDSAELLRHMFDLISSGNSASGSQPSNPLQEGLSGGRDLGSLETSRRGRYHSSHKDVSAPSSPSQLITKHFQGSQEITIVCDTCKTASSKQEPFLFLSLPCGKESSTLEQLISNSLASEHLSLENQYHCETCAHKSDAVRQPALNKIPDTFIFTINRFSYDKKLNCRSKHLSKVQVPAKLRFVSHNNSKFELIDPVTPQNSDIVYQLYATVIHSGSSTESGHYYTYGVPSNYASDYILSNCAGFNDSRVSLVSDDLVNCPQGATDTPYLLFYQRSDTDLSVFDLEMADLTEIFSNNMKCLQQADKVSVGMGSSSQQSDNNDPDQDDSQDRNKRMYVKGCHSTDFAADSSRFIY